MRVLRFSSQKPPSGWEGFLLLRSRFARRYVYLKGESRRRWVQVHASRRSGLFERALCVQMRMRGCENVGVGVGVGGVPGALWRVEPRPLCRRRRTSERQRGGEREGEEGWQRASPGGCVETLARTVVTSKSSRPHPVWTPTPTVAQSSRGDHRDLPAGIFVINGFWPPPTRLQQPRHCSRSPSWSRAGGRKSLAFERARVRTHWCCQCPPYPCIQACIHDSRGLPYHTLAPGH